MGATARTKSKRKSRTGRGFEWDVLIVGGGPAGLSAALILGRCCRKVLLVDAGSPRNRMAKEMHAFLSRDGIYPRDFARLCRHELRRYPAVKLVDGTVEHIEKTEDGFGLRLPDGTMAWGRKLLIATGMTDELPEIEGFAALYGKSVFQCPYCDGWEMRGQPLAIYGRGKAGFEMARALTAWSDDLILCTDGAPRLSAKQRQALQHNGVRIESAKLARLESDRDGRLRAIVFRSGQRLPRRAVFLETKATPHSPLAEKLGCTLTRKGGIACGQYEATCVPSLYVAGNIIRDVQLALVAAAEGARAAFGINRTLTREEFDLRATGTYDIHQHGPAQTGTRRSA